uniref:Uncharacterized protein n=1 Tax=Nothobranchius furzeri TaxID=105023 RepID=A0A1A8U2H1_NOTFU
MDTALPDDDILELKAVEPEAAVRTSMDDSDTDTASSDTDTEEQTGWPEPLTALFDTTLRELSPQEFNVKSGGDQMSYRESSGKYRRPQVLPDNLLVLKPSHPYYYQIQLHMFVCDVNYCDFVVWTKKEFIVQRVDKDHKLLRDTLPKAQEAFVSQVLPELLTRRFDPALQSQRAC